MVSEFLKFLADNTIKRLEEPKSSLGYQYPSLRDHPLHSGEIWLQGKRADDGAEGLWRLYDGLYDVSSFIKDHPGGPDWLELTKGTDITETFEAHHISTKPERMLKQYFVRKAQKPRNSPFTFEENGFYKKLKKRLREKIETLPKHPVKRSKFLTDFLFFTFMITSLIAVMQHSYIVGIVSAIFLTMTGIAGHNFIHQKNNFRMYYFDFTMMSSRAFRISHALSHHIYTNTICDLEISFAEPLLQYMPIKKNFFIRYGSWLYSPILYTAIYIGQYIRTIIGAISARKLLRIQDYIPIFHVLLLYQLGGKPITTTLSLYMFIEAVSSFFFALIGLNAGHHHPDVFHDGDDSRTNPKIDWGLHQLDCIIDKLEVTGSHFLVLVSFGDHALHHLFPTLDHGLLNYLYPVFEEVCKEFDINFRMRSQLNLLCGQFQQLAKTKPTKIGKDA